MSYERTAEPIKMGYLMDFRLPEGFPEANRADLIDPFTLVFEEGLAHGVIDRPIEVIYREVEGLPKGSVKAVIAHSVPVSRIIPNIITKMNLPAISPDGQPMSYALDHKEGGRRLLESWSLVEGGVQNGDHLIVYPEVVAGLA